MPVTQRDEILAEDLSPMYGGLHRRIVPTDGRREGWRVVFNRPERSENQLRHLEAWAEVDPEGSLNAAVAEYSQINLYQFKDAEKSAAALSQISDPVFRTKAEGWRRDWEGRK